MRTAYASCNLCEAICGLKLTLSDQPPPGKGGAEGSPILRIEGDPDDPLSRGHICPKGVALADLYDDPDRLRRPIRRQGDAWQEIEWEDAFDLVATRLAETQRRHGRDAVGVYLGNPNAHSIGAMTHGLALVKALRTRNLFSASSVDQLPHQLVASLMFGHQLLLPVPDLDRTDHFLVFGANPMASNGSLMTAPGMPRRLRELRARGGRLIVLDPRRTETAQVADEHHFVRPGSDVFVILAMLHELIGSDRAAWPSYAGSQVDRAAVAAAVEPFTTTRAAEASGLAADTIAHLVHDFADADSAVAYGRLGISAAAHGTLAVWGITMLNLLTGNLDRAGGAMFTTPAIDITGTIPRGRRGTPRRGLVGPGHHGAWRSRVRDLPETANELPVAALAEEIETGGRGQIKALLTIAGNPVLSTPDGARLDRALGGLDFMVSVDFYLNETTRHADVVLPPVMHLERDHYDLVFHALAVRNTARLSPAALPPSPGSRADWQIFGELARRYARAARWSRRRRLALAARTKPSPTRLLALLLRGGRGPTLAALRRTPSGIDLGALRPAQLPARLPRGRVDVFPPLIAEALAELPPPTPVAGDQLLLIGRRHQRDCNSWLHNAPRLVRGKARHHLLAHPDDLAARSIPDGAAATVTSAVGSVVVEVRSSDDMMPGVVSLPHGYGHGRLGTRMARAAEVAGVSINDLTDPARLDVSGNAALTGVPVTLQLRA